MVDRCSSSGEGRKAALWFFRDKLFLLALAIVTVLAASYGLAWLELFRSFFVMYVRMMFWPLCLGLLLGGAIDYYVPREYVSLALAGNRKRNILYAVTWGFLMTLCSHGILALAIQLYKKGASPSSVVAFLLASPWANFPLTLMLVGFFGFAKAAFIIGSALVVAFLTGLVFQSMEAAGMIERNPDTFEVDPRFDLVADLKMRRTGYRFNFHKDLSGIIKGAGALASMVVWWILLGMVLASAAGAYIPAEFFHRFMGNSVPGMFGTLLAAVVLETCSTGTAPLAFEIYRQTSALGNALIFLLAGVATNYTAIGLLWVNAGRRTALWMPVICVPLIFLFGTIGNAFFR